MSDQQVRAIKSLEVDNVKIYETRGEKLSVLAKGKLEILYLPEFDQFVLRLNSFKYILSLHLPIMASLGEGSCRSYVLPNIGGHYIMKLKSASTAAVVRNMETIFSSYSQFSYQQNHEHDLENQAHRRGDYPIAFDHEAGVPEDSKSSNQSEIAVKASNYIKIGGDFFKQNFMKAANYIGKNVNSSKDEAAQVQGPNQLSVKTIEELRSSNDDHLVDIPRYEVAGLTTLGKEIEKIALSHTDQDIGVKLHPTTDSRWPTIKKTALESAHSLWRGMDDALGVLTKTVKAKKASMSIPQDNMDIAFKKIDQNIKGEAPLPMHQISPNQQQSELGNNFKTNYGSQSQENTSSSSYSNLPKSGSILRNLGAIKQKIVNIRGGQSKENLVA